MQAKIALCAARLAPLYARHHGLNLRAAYYRAHRRTREILNW